MQRLSDIELNNLSDKDLTLHFEKDQERLSLVYQQYVKYLIRTPRELKRIFNNLRLISAQTEGMVSFTDLYCLSVISIKAQHIYQSLKDTPEMYIGRSFDDGYSFKKAEDVVSSHKTNLDDLVAKCLVKDQKYIRGLLEEIFPLLSDSSYSLYGKEYDQLGRVASQKRLHIALHYQVPTGFAADTDIKDFINGKIDREGYLQKAIDEDFAERFFELINQYIKEVNDSEILNILISIYNVFLHSDYIDSYENARHGFFGFEPFRNIVWLTNKLVGVAKDKVALIDRLIEIGNYLPVTADILRRLMVQYGDITSDNPILQEEKWVNEDKYDEIKENWSLVAIKELVHGNILDSVYASHVYYILFQTSSDSVKALFDCWFRDADGVEKIAKLIGRCGSDSTNGPYAQIDESQISNLLNYNELKKLVNLELSSGKQLTNYLKAVYMNISTGQTYYLNNATKGVKL